MADNPLDGHVRAYQGGSPYDFDNGILLNWYSRRVVELAPSARAVLELGLGHGHSTQVFARAFERHVVLEGSPAVIATFREKAPDCRAEVVETYFEAFDTPERFDAIVMGFVLEHVERPAEILERYRRFLRPGGALFAAVPNAESMNRRLGQLAGDLPDIVTLSEHDLLLGHRRFYTAASFREELADAGFRVDRMEGIYLKPLATRQMVALALAPAYLDALCRLGIPYPELSCGLLAQAADAR